MIKHCPLRSSTSVGTPPARFGLVFLLAFWLSPRAEAHLQPTTLVALEIGQDHVAMHLHIPLNELELAFGHDVTLRPEQTRAAWEAPLRAYLEQHIRPLTPSGKAWTVQVLDMKVERAEQTRSRPFQEVSHGPCLPHPAHGRPEGLRFALRRHHASGGEAQGPGLRAERLGRGRGRARPSRHHRGGYRHYQD